MAVMILFVVVVVVTSFLLAWNIQNLKIEYLKGELQLEKAKVEYYKKRRKQLNE